MAADRLKFMLATERAHAQLPWMEDMKRELIEVIKKYTEVERVDIRTEQNQHIDMLEVEIVLGKKKRD